MCLDQTSTFYSRFFFKPSKAHIFHHRFPCAVHLLLYFWFVRSPLVSCRSFIGSRQIFSAVFINTFDKQPSRISLRLRVQMQLWLLNDNKSVLRFGIQTRNNDRKYLRSAESHVSEISVAIFFLVPTLVLVFRDQQLPNSDQLVCCIDLILFIQPNRTA